VKPLQKVAVAFILGISLTSACPLSFGQTADQQPEQPAKNQPQPDATGLYKVGGPVTPPRIIYSVEPRFTWESRNKKVQGISLLTLTVGTDGLPHDITVTQSIAEKQPPNLRSVAEGLDAEAVKAVEQYRFKPATLDAKPVPVKINIEVNFHLLCGLRRVPCKQRI
jgi:protein TonB